MTATNLESANRLYNNSPRDLADASEVSSIGQIGATGDATAGATFKNTGNQLLCIVGGSGSDGAVHILRNGTDSEYVGSDFGDDSGHAYDTVTIAGANHVYVVGPFDPKRYNDASGLLTVLDTDSENACTFFVIDIASRRTARSTPTKGYRADESSNTQLGPVD